MLIIIEMFLRSATPHTMAEELSRVYFYNHHHRRVYLFIIIFMEIYVPNRGGRGLIIMFSASPPGGSETLN